VPAIVERVLDPDFYPSDRYANLVVQEIPARKQLDVCQELFVRRDRADPDKVKFFFAAVLNQMTADEVTDFIQLVSRELRETDDDDTIRFVLGALPAHLWTQVDEAARLRIEHKLIRSVQEGTWHDELQRCQTGGLGTWLARILTYMTLRDDLWTTVFHKLGHDYDAQSYALYAFIIPHVQDQFAAPPPRLAWEVNRKLDAGDRRFESLASGWRSDRDRERSADDPWVKPFAKALDEFTAAAEPELLEIPPNLPF
jgi:hypothetical protein